MKAKSVILCLLTFVLGHSAFGEPLGTAFTYLGRLNNGGNAASGYHDFQFKLFDALASGVQQGSTVVSNAIAVSNGLFTVTLDFGPGVFDGSARWLDITVRTNGAVEFTPLTPRQLLTPTPYALYAPSAGTAATATTAAAAQGVTIVGGHTEVTDAVTRPVVAATTIGVARRSDLREKRAVRAGDRILLTKGLAAEGTALLARELGERLRALGMSDTELSACRDLLERVSVVPEARIAAGFAGVRAMHDVTEGGLATALRELASAAGRDLFVHADRVPVLPEAARLCALLGADPLGLIGSGSLLICCDPAEAEALKARLDEAGIAAADIGELGGAHGGSHTAGGPSRSPDATVTAFRDGRPVLWPEFAVDEAARILAGEV